MKIASILFLLFSTIGLSSLSLKSTADNPTVVMTEMKFTPETITVAVGTSITWSNAGKKIHTATADDGSWDTGDIAAGSTKSLTFNTAGTYKYNCVYHEGMTGTVIVTK